ncbi:MAG TPA: hypothetical protein PKK48_06070, partial [Phycisphaerae bacterium]|nr:hypothetical protein [Phycisphaerae bacterium]
MKIAIYSVCLCSAVLMLVGGCAQPKCPGTELLTPMNDLVSDYNANAAAMPRLWARTRIQISGKYKGVPFNYGSVSPKADPNGLLIIRKNDKDPFGPQDFVLIYREAGNELARLGISRADGVYYSWNKPIDSCWYGRLALAGAQGVNVPLDPVQLPGIVGIVPLPQKGDNPLAVHYVRQEWPFAQVLEYIERQRTAKGCDGHMLLKRETFFRWQIDPAQPTAILPQEVFMVKLYDNRGVNVMTAYMDNYQPVKLEDADPNQPVVAKLPTDIKLVWQSGECVHMLLPDMTTEDKVDPAVFEFYNRLPAGMGAKTRRVDANVTSEG